MGKWIGPHHMTALSMRGVGISRSSHELIARKYRAFHGVIRTEGMTKLVLTVN